jgi:hypothetical protein
MKIWMTIVVLIISASLFGQNNKEFEYIKSRNISVDNFKTIQVNNYDWSETDKQDNDSLLVLEKMLREIMKDSRIDSVVRYGKISLETLQPELGFGMLDGLVLNKYSPNYLQIFVTSKALFFDFFNPQQINSIDNLTHKQLDVILTSLVSDASATVFYSEKISTYQDNLVYGGIGTIAQDIGRTPPFNIFVLIGSGNYIYIVQKFLEKPINEIRECQATYDSINSISQKYYKTYQASNLKDTIAINKTFELEEEAWNEYCECYQKKFQNNYQYETFQKEINKIVQYILR